MNAKSMPPFLSAVQLMLGSKYETSTPSTVAPLAHTRSSSSVVAAPSLGAPEQERQRGDRELGEGLQV
jgi:hypothetical protein